MSLDKSESSEFDEEAARLNSAGNEQHKTDAKHGTPHHAIISSTDALTAQTPSETVEVTISDIATSIAGQQSPAEAPRKSNNDAGRLDVSPPLTSDVEEGDAPNRPRSSSSAAATKDRAALTASNVGMFAENADDAASVFSFDSHEQRPRTPMVGGTVNGSTTPFPSVVAGNATEYEHVINVCPCRCLFFTLKETICLVFSALGCAVYLAGLVALVLFLEGSAFE